MAPQLAREVGLSRSAFSERFSQKVGVPPMQYLMDWRMALAKAMLQRDAPPLGGCGGRDRLSVGQRLPSGVERASARNRSCAATMPLAKGAYA
jgi:hypothetical protein